MLATLGGSLPTRVALGFTVLLLCAPADAGKLGDAGRATRSPSSNSSSSSSNRSPGDSSCSSRRDDDDGAQLALWILTSPWSGPYYALESTERGSPTYEDYPYSHGSNGLLRYPEIPPDDALDEVPAKDPLAGRSDSASGKSMAGQIRLEGGYILGGVYRGGVGGRLMPPGRVELDVNFHALAEALVDGSVDRATFGNAHLGLRFAESEHVQFRTAFGYQQFADKEGVEPGIDFSYGFEAEIGAHLILAASGDLGSAGHAFVWQARATLGVMIDRMEIYAGYDHIGIERVGVGDVPLGGPTAGIRAWL